MREIYWYVVAVIAAVIIALALAMYVDSHIPRTCAPTMICDCACLAADGRLEAKHYPYLGRADRGGEDCHDLDTCTCRWHDDTTGVHIECAGNKVANCGDKNWWFDR